MFSFDDHGLGGSSGACALIYSFYKQEAPTEQNLVILWLNYSCIGEMRCQMNHGCVLTDHFKTELRTFAV